MDTYETGRGGAHDGPRRPHIPVMVGPVVEHLLTDESRRVLDGTVGAGGHAEAILEARPDVTLIGVDRDPGAITLAQERLARFGERARLVHGDYADFDTALGSTGIDGVLLDLGVSSMQIDSPHRGFSYANEGPLDMRMSGDGRPAGELLRRYDAEALAGVLRDFGGVRRPRRVAREIHECAAQRRMESTIDLRRAVERALGSAATPAELSRVFQAIRISVNGELDRLTAFLDNVLDRVARGGRIVIISYHSLEDRKVKAFFRRESTGCLCPPELPLCVCDHQQTVRVLTPRPIRPSGDEAESNPRSRSARLRAAERITPGKVE